MHSRDRMDSILDGRSIKGKDADFVISITLSSNPLKTRLGFYFKILDNHALCSDSRDSEIIKNDTKQANRPLESSLKNNSF